MHAQCPLLLGTPIASKTLAAQRNDALCQLQTNALQKTGGRPFIILEQKERGLDFRVELV